MLKNKNNRFLNNSILNTQKEDEQLHELVELFGPKNWEKLAVYHSTRNGKQMRERWLSYAKNGG